GGLEAEEIPYLFVACSINALVVAGFGLWVSARSATMSRALLGTLIAILVAWFGHWVIVAPIAIVADLNGPEVQWFWDFETFGLTPPVALDYLASRGEYRRRSGWYYDELRGVRVACTLGLLLWFAASVLLLFRAERCFRAAVGRGRVSKPAPPREKHEARSG